MPNLILSRDDGSFKLKFQWSKLGIVFLLIAAFFVFHDVRATIIDIQETWSSSGDNQSYASFGARSASYGDINGDGYDDVILSTPFYDLTAGNDNTGKAYLYLGSASGLSSSAAWTSSGSSQSGESFGNSTAIGDINGDGFDDVIVGASGYDTSNSNAGRVYLYLGSASGLSRTASSWLPSGDDQANAYFGVSVSAGDINNDGYDDVIVGASGYDTSNSNAGKVYFYLGSASGLSLIVSWSSSGDNQTNASFGSPTMISDVNNDGYKDLIVSARSYNSSTGRVYLYLGSVSGLSSVASWISTGEANSNQYGDSISANDVNGDGFDDLIIGAPYTSTGKAYLYFGNTSGLSSIASWTSTGDNQTSADFGESVSSAGDVNGDGYGDVVIGAGLYGFPDTGKAYLFLGSALGLGSGAVWTSTGENQADQYYGWTVADVGDIDKDGYGEFMVGAQDFDTEITNAGKVYLYSNQADFSVSINSGKIYTNSKKVTLFFSAYNNPVQMIISENSNFSGAIWESYSATKSFSLSSGDRTRTIYAKFRDTNNDQSKIVSDSIILAVNKARFVTKAADFQKSEILIKKKNKKYSIADFSLNFLKLPKKLQKKKYYLQVQKVKKYPQKYSGAKKSALKKYWTIKTNLNKYRLKKKKDDYKIEFIFKYTKKEWKALKKKNKGLKEKELALKKHNSLTKKWENLSKIKHNLKKNTFKIEITSFVGKRILFAIGEK